MIGSKVLRFAFGTGVMDKRPPRCTAPNTIEGAWSHLKRSIMGTYHRPSKEHLSKYCAEFEFTYNTRNNPPEIKFRKIIDKNQIRVSYRKITGT